MSKLFNYLATRRSIIISLILVIGLNSCEYYDDRHVPYDEIYVFDNPENGKIISDQYLVIFNNDYINQSFQDMPKNYEERCEMVRHEINTVLAEYEVYPETMEHVFSQVLNGMVVQLDGQTVSALKQDKRVEYIEPDRILTLGKGGKKPPKDDPPPAAQETPWGVTRVGGSVDGTGKTLWIIDTGIDYDHPDLNVDIGKSRTFAKGTRNADDQHGHGTHVAGIAAALDNDIGVVGVAPNASVVSVRVFDKKNVATLSGVIAGIDYVAAAASAGDVANLSIGSPASQALDDAVINAASTGIIFTIAAGNDYDDANLYSPARANGANIYTISAMDINDDFAYFSNYSNPPIEYCAPGYQIKSTWKDGQYYTMSGTSMAAPHAAGVLLVTGGIPDSDGTVNNDPDNNPDHIISIY